MLRSVAIAKQHGAEVVISQRGRAVQMNAGASVAEGKAFLECVQA